MKPYTIVKILKKENLQHLIKDFAEFLNEQNVFLKYYFHMYRKENPINKFKGKTLFCPITKHRTEIWVKIDKDNVKAMEIFQAKNNGVEGYEGDSILFWKTRHGNIQYRVKRYAA